MEALRYTRIMFFKGIHVDGSGNRFDTCSPPIAGADLALRFLFDLT